MADEIDLDALGAVEVPKEETPIKPTKIETAANALGQLTSFGLADEMVGAIDSPKGALEATKKLIGMDIDEENPEYQQYKKARDFVRGETEASFKENPKTAFFSSLAGSPLVGGIGVIPASAAMGVGASSAETPQGLAVDTAVSTGTGLALSKLMPTLFGDKTWGASKNLRSLVHGEAAPLSGVAADIAGKTAGAAGAGALAGGITGVATGQDPLEMAKLGALGGVGARAALGATRLAGDAIRPLIKPVVDATLETGVAAGTKAFGELAEQGQREVYRDVANDVYKAGKQADELMKQATDEVSDIYNQAYKGQLLEKEKAIKLRDNAKKQLVDVKEKLREQLEAAQKLKIAEKIGFQKEAAKKVIDTSKKLESSIGKLESSIGSSINTVTDNIPDVQFSPSVGNSASVEVSQALMSSGMPDAVPHLVDEIKTVLGGTGVDGYRSARKYFFDQSRNRSLPMNVRRKFGEYYGVINDEFSSTLEQAGLKHQADALKKLNKQYTAVKELNHVVDRGDKLYSVGDKTTENLGFIKNFANETSPETLSQRQTFEQLLQKADPEAAQNIINELQGTSQLYRQAQEPIPSVATQARDLTKQLQTTPAYQGVKEQANLAIPEVIQKSQADLSQEALQSQLGQQSLQQKAPVSQITQRIGIPQVDVTTGEVIPPKGIGRIFGTPKDDLSANFKQSSVEPVERALAQISGEERAQDIVNRGQKFSKYATLQQDLTGNPVASNAYIDPKRPVYTATKMATGLAGGAARLALKGTAQITEAMPNIMRTFIERPETLQTVAQKAAQNPETAQLAAKLMNASQKDQFGRNAALFTVMQNPEQREQLHKLMGLESTPSEEEEIDLDRILSE